MQPTGEHAYNHFLILRLGPSQRMHAIGLTAWNKLRSLERSFFLRSIDDFEWCGAKTSVSRSAMAQKGIEKHARKLAGVDDREQDV